MEALYKAIKDELVKLIKSNVYQEGEEIPSDEELAKTHGVSRPTVRRAIQELVDEGYLERRPYHGTIVCPSRIEQAYTSVLRSFNDEMLQNDHIPKTRVINARLDRASKRVASQLEIEDGARVFKLVRLRYADGHPNVIVQTYVPLDVYPGIAKVDFRSKSLYAFFEDCSKPVVVANRRLEIDLADPNMAALLDIPQGDPVYRFSTTARIESGRIVEYSLATYRGRSNVFAFETTSTRLGRLSLEQ